MTVPKIRIVKLVSIYINRSDKAKLRWTRQASNLKGLPRYKELRSAFNRTRPAFCHTLASYLRGSRWREQQLMS